ncbi:MAG TPA: hypothetical protein VK618_11675 [Flavitalea sp.]|nr:hypothetical protein [Flavitalea sp.]
MELRNIAEGWAKSLRLVKISQANRELAVKRVGICVECPHAKEHWLKKFIDGMLKRDEIGSGIGCELCGCPINEKALVTEEKCPDGRW